jgi:ankyrin repeat protein
MSKLMSAIEANDQQAVERLLNSGYSVNEVDQKSKNWPVIIAAFKGRTEILELLLKANADLTVLDPGMHATALHAAAYAGHLKEIEMLIKYGISIDQKGPFNGYTALHDAVSQGHVETARALLAGGSDQTIKNNSGQTALDMAHSNKDQMMVMLLKEMG